MKIRGRIGVGNIFLAGILDALNTRASIQIKWLIPSGNLILILFGRFENAAFHIPFSSENPFLKISSSHFLASF
jgi:hypothetical protein